MAQAVPQGFQIGDRAWLMDGRSALVRVAAFFEVLGEWGYLLEGIPGTFLESGLFHVNPVVDAPEPPPPVEEPPPPPPTLSPIGLTSAEVQAIIDTSLAAVVGGLIVAIDVSADRAIEAAAAAADPRFEALSNSIIRNVMQLTAIENSAQELDTISNETGPGGFSGFLRRAGAFIGAPFTSLLDAVGDWFLSEVRDGLNR